MADLVNTPQFKLPFRVAASGTVQTLEQDTMEERIQNAVVCLRYEKGQRTALPEFGLPDQALRQGGANLAEIVSSVILWEPDIDPKLVESILESNSTEQGITMEFVTPSVNNSEGRTHG